MLCGCYFNHIPKVHLNLTCLLCMTSLVLFQPSKGMYMLVCHGGGMMVICTSAHVMCATCFCIVTTEI